MFNKELIGKVWYQEEPEKKEQKLLCFTTWNCVFVDGKELHFSTGDDGVSIVLYSEESDVAETRYIIDYSDGALTIKGDEQSLLTGEWKPAESKSADEKHESLELPDYGIDTANWMARVPSDRNLSDICIPGTHDSAAYKCKSAPGREFVLTQSEECTFEQQLLDGIRSFDLRVDEGLLFFHGKWYLEQDLNQCLLTMSRFLEKHSTETIIITVKPEYCDDDNKFKARMREIVEIYRKIFYLGTEIPNLSDVRGKIVLLRRFEFPNNLKMGIDMTGWKDDTTFVITTPNGLKIQVQDRYKAWRDEKVGYIIQDINDAREHREKMHITYFSVAGFPGSVEFYATVIQRGVRDAGVLDRLVKYRHNGIYPLDFYKAISPNYIHSFIQSNFV